MLLYRIIVFLIHILKKMISSIDELFFNEMRNIFYYYNFFRFSTKIWFLNFF